MPADSRSYPAVVPAVLPDGAGGYVPCPDVLTPREAALYLRLDLDGNWQQTLRYYREKRKLKGTRIGKRVMYTRMALAEFLDAAGRSTFERAMAGFEQGIWQRFELDIRRKEGGTVSMLVAPSPLLDSGGLARGSFAVYTEIGEKKQALYAMEGREQELLAENRRLKQTAPPGEDQDRQKR